MNVSIDPGCIGCTLCANTCPSVFHMGGDGLAYVQAQPAPADEPLARQAAASCPVSVIRAE